MLKSKISRRYNIKVGNAGGTGKDLWALGDNYLQVLIVMGFKAQKAPGGFITYILPCSVY